MCIHYLTESKQKIIEMLPQALTIVILIQRQLFRFRNSPSHLLRSATLYKLKTACLACAGFHFQFQKYFQQQPRYQNSVNFSDFGLHFHQRAETFTWIQSNIWIIWKIFELMCTTEITEIFWTKGTYFSVYWNYWNSVNFIEISLKVKTNCCLLPSTECNEASRLYCASDSTASCRDPINRQQ